MKTTLQRSLKSNTLFLFAFFLLSVISCNSDSENTIEPEETVNENIVDLTHLPFGGSFVLRRDKGDTHPLIEHLWLCGVPTNGAGNSNATDWTNSDGTWDFTKKPIVEGEVNWPSEFEVMLDGNGNRIITGNALPDHPTGIFPIDPASVAYKYDRNMNKIVAHEILYTFPEIPEVAANPSCVTYGPSGISLTGSAIYHGASTLGNDAAAHEILDNYGGHTDGTERYHYHYLSDKLQNHIHPHTTGHSALMGYMNDGFGIYGPYGEDGKLLSSKDLDECHGHTHPVLWDGKMIELYHYHWTYDFPYNIGCFKGTPN
ncbi:MAG: YHYH protein [Polaribacter sp.]